MNGDIADEQRVESDDMNMDVDNQGASNEEISAQEENDIEEEDNNNEEEDNEEQDNEGENNEIDNDNEEEDDENATDSPGDCEGDENVIDFNLSIEDVKLPWAIYCESFAKPMEAALKKVTNEQQRTWTIAAIVYTLFKHKIILLRHVPKGEENDLAVKIRYTYRTLNDNRPGVRKKKKEKKEKEPGKKEAPAENKKIESRTSFTAKKMKTLLMLKKNGNSASEIPTDGIVNAENDNNNKHSASENPIFHIDV